MENADSADPKVTRRKALASAMKPSKGQLVAAGLLALLGLALVAQARSNDQAGLDELRESELVALLDDATNRVDVLREEVQDLQADRARLQGSQGDEAAREAAEQRLQSYQILAGTVSVRGPGVRVQVTDSSKAITQTMLLDAIQELRDAGAEAIQIGPVRVVASSHVTTQADDTLRLDEQPLESPYQILAIGDARTLGTALTIPGGFSDSLRGAGAQIDISERDSLTIDAVHTGSDLQFAEPLPGNDSPEPTSPDRAG